MFLQLADNETDTMGGDNYDTLRTTQGNLFIRKDLSAQGKGAASVKSPRFRKFDDPFLKPTPISKVAGVLGKVAQFAPIPGASLIGKGLTTISKIPIKSPLLKPTPNLPIFSKPKAATPKAATPTAAMPTAAMPVVMEQKESFFNKYKMPILIGGGVLLVGAAILLLKKKK